MDPRIHLKDTVKNRILSSIRPPRVSFDGRRNPGHRKHQRFEGSTSSAITWFEATDLLVRRMDKRTMKRDHPS